MRPYIDLAQRLGSLFVQWRGELSERIDLIYEGEICEHDTRILTAAFLAGLLTPISAEPINVVNARKMAERARTGGLGDLAWARREHRGNLITARTPSVYEAMDVAGAIIQGAPYVVSIDSQRLEL